MDVLRKTEHQILAGFVYSLSSLFKFYDLFRGAVNRSNFYFLTLLFTSLHVSACTGHPQVKYTQRIRFYAIQSIISYYIM
jgi:hypothetical protein